LGVDGDRWRRCARGCFDVQEVSVEVVQGVELGLEGVAGALRCGDGAGLRVHLERDERERVW